jgi:hypothetical protein
MRLGYDFLTEETTASEPFDGLTPISTAPDDIRRTADAGSAPGPAPLADASAGGDGLLPPAPPGGTADGGGGPPLAQACQLSGNEGVVNGFDTPTGGLQARGPGNPTSSWTSNVGSPSAGALEFQSTSAGGGELYYSGSLGDLSGRLMSLNVQVASGTGVRVRLFVESGPQRLRARAPFSSPPLGQWDCSQVNVSSPDTAEVGFDPANIVGAGLEIEASDQVRVYVDQIAY